MNALPARLRARARIELGDYPLDAAWSGDGAALAVAGGEGAVWMVPMVSGASPQVLARHEGGVLGLSWQKAGRLLASSGQDGVVLLSDSRSLESRSIHVGRQWSEQLAFSDNGRLLAVASGRALQLFDEAGQAQQRFEQPGGAIAALAWRPRALEIAAAGNGGVQLHRLEPVSSLQQSWRGAGLCASWNQDGRMLATGTQDGGVHLWNVAANTAIALPGFGSKAFATEWSANGRYLAVPAADAVIVWDCGNRNVQKSRPLELRAHSDRLTALRFRPAGTWLVSAARDRRLLLWRIGHSPQPEDAHLLADECTLLRFSRDGSKLAVGDARGGLTVFDFAS
jgi:WD40 repeat protein